MVPILITGVFRSGTTLLGNIFSEQPRTHVDNNKFAFWRDTVNDMSLQNASVQDIRQAYLDHMSKLAEPGCDYFVEKTTMAWHNAELFFKAFPEGKLIVIYRDPRDSLCSMKYYNQDDTMALFHTYGAFYLCMAFYWRSLADFVKKTDLPIFNLRYENLADDSVGVIRKTLDYIGYVEEVQKINNFNTVSGNSSFGKHQGISGKSIGRWSEKLEDREVGFCERICTPYLEEFGYEPSGKMNSKSKDASMVMQILLSKSFRGHRIRDGRPQRPIAFGRGSHLRKKWHILRDYLTV